nr:TIGR02677 family protein [uncultured Thermomonospora sp.]
MKGQGPRPFAHLDSPSAPLYRRVMRAFMDNKRRFVVHLRPEDVVEALRQDGGPPVSAEAIGDALARLAEWGNLRADPDTGRVTTVEDFYRARYLYQLSREGEAAERALEVYEKEIGRRGELQAVALEDLRVRLRSLRELAERSDPDPAIVHSLLLEISGRLDSLAANASAFMGSLQRTIDLQDIDEEVFLAYKDRLITYLERFVSELVVKAHDIAATLRELTDVTALLRLAAEREAADVAPGADDDPSADPAVGKLRQWQERWTGLRSWFLGDRAHPSQAALLRQRTRQAILDLLAAVGVLVERRAGRSDRSADFRELARWFAQAPTEEDAHRLWRAAFGLSPARHHTAPSDAESVPAATRWADAPPVEIAPRLRATGHYQRRGRAARVRDRSIEKAYLARQLAAERAQAEAARRRLATGRPVLLSELGALDREEFGLFLRLLGEALSAGPPGADGVIRTQTADGALELVLRPVGGGRTAAIATEDGTMYGPDHELTIINRAAAS